MQGREHNHTVGFPSLDSGRPREYRCDDAARGADPAQKENAVLRGARPLVLGAGMGALTLASLAVSIWAFGGPPAFFSHPWTAYRSRTWRLVPYVYQSRYG